MLLLAMVVLRHEREVGGLLLHNISRTTWTTIFLGFVRIACLIKHISAITALASETSTKVTFGDILKACHDVIRDRSDEVADIL